MAQSFEIPTLGFGSDHDLSVVRSSPTWGSAFFPSPSVPGLSSGQSTLVYSTRAIK